MPKRLPEQLSVTWNQVAAFRAARHHLIERAPKKALMSVASDMAGAQAQLLSAAQISLFVRVGDLEISDIQEALNKRRLVKAACMRNTLFLVPARELATFALNATRRGEKEILWALKQGVPAHKIDAALDAAFDILAEPLTRPEIAERVSQMLGVPQRAARGSGWGNRQKVAAVSVGKLNFPVVYFLRLVAARGIICYGPSRANEPTFVRADTWLPKWRAVSKEQVEETLLRHYLRSYGPATAADFAFWSGLSLTEARAIWKREQDNLAPVDVEGQAATILREDIKQLTHAEFERPLIRLLPYFDSFILGHKDRQHLLTLQHHSKVYRAQGWIAPVVLVNGRLVAVWQHTRAGNRLHIQVTKFEPMSRLVVQAVREEAEDLGRFLEIENVDVQTV